MPAAYDNLVYGHECAGKWGPLEIGDILDRAGLGKVLAHYKPGAIFRYYKACLIIPIPPDVQEKVIA